MKLFDLNPYQMRILIKKFEYFIFETFCLNHLELDFKCVPNKFHFRILFFSPSLDHRFCPSKKGFLSRFSPLFVPEVVSIESPKKGVELRI